MKKNTTIWTLFLALLTTVSLAQDDSNTIVAADSSSLVVPSDSLHEELYVVAPAFEFIPGEDSPELVADRLSCLSTSAFPLTYNKTIQSFIDYFTIRDREWTKSM
ncbi:MAG: hypothetical protein ACO263_04665, partial [Cyclobacteriaceae bacterium]